MTPEEEPSVAYHVRELAKLLYKDADPKRLTNLGDLEAVVREQVHNHLLEFSESCSTKCAVVRVKHYSHSTEKTYIC